MVTEGEFFSKDIKSVNKVITVLKYLNQGRIFKIPLSGIEVKLAETHRGGFTLMHKMTQTTTEDPTEREVWMTFDMSLDHFSNSCNRLTDDEIFIMNAELGIQQYKKTFNKLRDE